MRHLAIVLTAGVMAALAVPAVAQKKWNGPRPPKPDIPYLLHAGTLVETESGVAKDSRDKDATVYTIAGAASPARTPVPEPIFLFQSEKINPDKLTLFRMEIRGGQRVLTMPDPGKRKKDAVRPLFLMVTPLDRGLFKVEVNEYLADGEYCLSPEGSNQVYCFAAY